MCIYRYRHRLYRLQHYTQGKTVGEREAGQSLARLSDVIKWNFVVHKNVVIGFHI